MTRLTKTAAIGSIGALIATLLFAILSSCGSTDAREVSITFNWTAPGDDGAVGQAAEYRLARSTDPGFIDQVSTVQRTDTISWLENGAQVDSIITWTIQEPTGGIALEGLPSPGVAGSAETYSTILDLGEGVHYFAIWTADEVGNWSPPSNVQAIYIRDVNEPDQISDFSITFN